MGSRLHLNDQHVIPVEPQKKTFTSQLGLKFDGKCDPLFLELALIAAAHFFSVFPQRSRLFSEAALTPTLNTRPHEHLKEQLSAMHTKRQVHFLLFLIVRIGADTIRPVEPPSKKSWQ